MLKMGFVIVIASNDQLINQNYRMVPKINSSNKIDSLQGVRAFAAIFVMLFHGAIIFHNIIDYSYLNNFFMVGFMGVDVFFVLSGFIIFYTSDTESFNSVVFFKKRFIRIFPIYWVVLTGLIVLHLIFPTPGMAGKYTLANITASYTLYPVYYERYVLGLAWTLTYEVVFYIVFGLSYSISKKCFYYIFLAWSIIIITTYFLHIKSSVFAIDALINPVILNFGFGCILAYFFKAHQTLNYWKWIIAFGAMLFISTWLIYYVAVSNDATAFSTLMSRVYLFGIPSAVLILGLLYFDKKVPKLLVSIGDGSYSLYLIHSAVITILLQIILKIHLVRYIKNFIGVTMLLVLTIAISQIFYKYVEKPLLKRVKNLIR